MIVERISEPMIPMGRSRAGFRVSSATVETASNPIYAKNTIAAPDCTPTHPFGRKGWKLAPFMYPQPTITKNPRTISLRITIVVFIVALADADNENDRDQSHNAERQNIENDWNAEDVWRACEKA